MVEYSANQQSIYGIIGNPVRHSLSPAMQNSAFEALDVDASYQLFPLERNELPEFFNQLHQADSPIFGLNVTVPYKEEVIPLLDCMSPFAEKAGAVNTVVITQKRKLQGFNTDGPGFLAHLTELGVSTAGKRIVILGAGGTTRAILSAVGLLPDHPESIKLYNRTRARAEALVQDLGQRVDMSMVEIVDCVDDLNIELSDILINTTSVGMGQDGGSLIDESLLHANLLVYDVIYNPLETPLLKMARTQGAKTANGLGLLFYQGVLALEHWAGMAISEDVKVIMRKTLEDKAGV